VQAWIKALTGDEFHDFAGSVVVHAVGGWIALPAVLLLGARAQPLSQRWRDVGAPAVAAFLSSPWARGF